MSSFVQIALEDASVQYDRLYTYRAEAGDAVRVGMRVNVPFGAGNRTRVGVVMEILSEVPDAAKIKPVASLYGGENALSTEQIMLIRFLHERTFCTWAEAIRAVLPICMQLHLENAYRIAEPLPAEAEAQLTPAERSFLEMLRSAKPPLGKAQRDTPEKDRLFRRLTALGCLLPAAESKQRIRDGKQKKVQLSPAFLMDESAFRLNENQCRAAEVLRGGASLTVRECAYRAGVSEAVVRNMVKRGICETKEIELLSIPRDIQPTISPANTVLSSQQQQAFNAVAEAVNAEKAAAFLLYGVTGSGKTAVFEQLIALTLRQGKKALLLLPEIALTPQVVQYFSSRFGSCVALIHSGLSMRQRADTEKLIRRGAIDLVIGTRSAVFAPLEHIGLIILDEEGEHSYRSEQAPRYHAGDVAKERARHHRAALVFASATPSLESRYLAERGVYKLLRMPDRYNQSPLPTVSVVDMNEERMNGNGSAFSLALADALAANLRNGEQSILLLNRRGYQTMFLCGQCREPLYCPNCSVPMTYHRVNDSLICHYCGHVQPPVEKCPKCGSDSLCRMGFGTQKLEEELQVLLPAARILRMDADTTMSRAAYEQGFRAFANGEYDILCGTQMIGKGLDFPNVTLVGVLSIDNALFSGDYRSYERTFSLVTQVVGRSGRGVKPGQAILQTFMPDHYVLNLAAQQDYDRFYEEEIALRRALLYPPICDICVIGFSGISETRVQQAAVRFVQLIAETVSRDKIRFPLRVLGPVPANYGKINGKYRYRLLLKCKNTPELRAFVRSLLEQSRAAAPARDVQIFADMNGDCGV